MVVNQITQKNRVHLNHKGAVMWITGLPCSGKTTLSEKLRLSLCHKNILTYIIDGDQIRKGLSSDLGFLKEFNLPKIKETSKKNKNWKFLCNYKNSISNKKLNINLYYKFSSKIPTEYNWYSLNKNNEFIPSFTKKIFKQISHLY